MCVCLQAVCKESSSPGLLGHNKQERSCWSVSNTAAAASAGAFINSGNKYFKRKQAKGQDVVSGLIWQFLHDVPLKWYFTKRVMDTRSNVVCLTFTHPHTFRIVFEPFQAREDSFPVLLPLSFAENYFQEVPGPANQRDLQQLVLGQHFWTLERGRRTFLIRKLNIFHERDDVRHLIIYIIMLIIGWLFVVVIISYFTLLLTPRTPNLSQMVQPHRKSISKLWLRMMITCSLPNMSAVAWSVYRVQSVPDHHSSIITSSAKLKTLHPPSNWKSELHDQNVLVILTKDN